MNAFAVLSTPDALLALAGLLCDSHDSGRANTSGLCAPRDISAPEWLLGIWIEGPGREPGVGSLRTPARLAHVESLALRVLAERRGAAVCRIGPHSRTGLLDLLMYTADPGTGRAPGRFVPVFRADEDPEVRQAEWRSLATRYPGAVLPPVLQDATGALSFGDFAVTTA